MDKYNLNLTKIQTEMNDYGDGLSSLKLKILELRRKRDEITTFVMKDRMAVTQIDEQITQLEREKQKIMFDVDEREQQCRKFDELIR